MAIFKVVRTEYVEAETPEEALRLGQVVTPSEETWPILVDGQTAKAEDPLGPLDSGDGFGKLPTVKWEAQQVESD